MELVQRSALRFRDPQAIPNRQATSNHREGGRDVEVDGTLNIRRILAGKYGSCMDRLALGN